MIVSAKHTDTKMLTEIALNSKAFWGYEAAIIESWRTDLTVTKAMISECEVHKFKYNEDVAGFYILNPPTEKTIELEMLFVLPEFIGKGIGKRLLDHSIQKARELNISFMTLLADPNAVPFYASQGFETVAKKESSISGRFLPIMQKDLKK